MSLLQEAPNEFFKGFADNDSLKMKKMIKVKIKDIQNTCHFYKQFCKGAVGSARHEMQAEKVAQLQR